MSLSMEERLKRRKLDALKRGVHRVTGGEALPISSHVIGIGKAGAGTLLETLRSLPADAPKLTGLAIDIGDGDLGELRRFAATLPPERAAITVIALPVPQKAALLEGLGRYDGFLRLEYPSFRWSRGYAPWLPATVAMPQPGAHVPRAIAKAIYGLAYYDGARPLAQALRAFAAAVEATRAQAMVSIVFGLGGGTGSGIAVDLARHLSSGLFGRRMLVAGIGVAPCDGDRAEHRGGALFAVLNELDCLGDEDKNRGIVQSCGELFRNPFTAGFILVPQQHVWAATGNLAATQRRASQEIATLIAGRGGANLWELLRLLNWVAAPSTQHSAARTPWGARWIHMLGFADADDGPVVLGPPLPARLGLRAEYLPEFIEMRLARGDDPRSADLAAALEQAFSPEVPPQLVGGGREGSAQFILPRIEKRDLRWFHESRDAYGLESWDQRLLDHALLLDQGLMLCEPSSRIDGMAGANLWPGESWVAVPLAALTDAPELPPARAAVG